MTVEPNTRSFSFGVSGTHITGNNSTTKQLKYWETEGYLENAGMYKALMEQKCSAPISRELLNFNKPKFTVYNEKIKQ